MDRREQARIAIFGMGCIGSYTAQLLAKNGVGTLTLADSTMVSLTKKGCYRTSGEPDSMRLRAVTEARRLKRLCPDIHILLSLPPCDTGFPAAYPPRFLGLHH